MPESNLKRGDTVLTYAYRSEGLSAAWVNGKYVSEFDISFAKGPDGCGVPRCTGTYIDAGEKVWWAQVELSSGIIGWVRSPEQDFQLGKPA
jgi:hypothetical protein